VGLQTQIGVVQSLVGHDDNDDDDDDITPGVTWKAG
jgi:hypothetical protein